MKEQKEISRFSRPMRWLSMLLSCAMLFMVLPTAAFAEEPLAAGEIAINELNFPDSSFRSQVSKSFDTDKNGSLSEEERNAVTSLKPSVSVVSFQGIEYFPHLKTLEGSGRATELDLSKNTELESIVILFNSQHLETLTLGSQPNLKTLKLTMTSLNALDLTQCPALEELQLESGNVQELDLSQCPALETVDVEYCHSLTELRLSSHPALKKLVSRKNELITSLDVSRCPALEQLSFTENALTALDVTNCPELSVLGCIGNQLTTLDLSRNPALTELYCDENQLSKLDLSANPLLKDFSSNNNQLKKLDLSNKPLLEEAYFNYNELTELDLSNDTALKKFSASFNQLTTLNVQNLTSLQQFWCTENRLTQLQMEGCTSLTGFNINHNNLTELNLQGLDQLTEFYSASNQLTSLDVRNLPVLKKFACEVNQLTELRIGNDPKLSSILCSNNNLTELDLSDAPAMGYVEADVNPLTRVDVTKCPKLEELYLQKGNLTELDVTQNPELRKMDVRFNELRELDLSQNEWLFQLYVGGNRMASLDLTNTRVDPQKDDSSPNLYSLMGKMNADGTFDLSTIPGFDVSRASSWVGGTVEGTILTVDADATTVSYVYACSDQRSQNFTFTDVKGHVHTYDQNNWKSDDDGHWHECVAGDGSRTAKEAHEIITWNIDRKPTEHTPGYMVGYCIICFHAVTKEIPPLGTSDTPDTPSDHEHTYKEWEHDDDMHWSVCTTCGNGTIGVHCYGEGVVTKPATEESTGTMEYTCSVCGYVRTETIPKLGDDSADNPGTTDPDDPGKGDSGNTTPDDTGKDDSGKTDTPPTTDKKDDTGSTGGNSASQDPNSSLLLVAGVCVVAVGGAYLLVSMLPVEVSGHVVRNDETAAALPGAEVQLWQGGTMKEQTTADADGAFRFSVPAGDYELRISYSSEETGTLQTSVWVTVKSLDPVQGLTLRL